MFDMFHIGVKSLRLNEQQLNTVGQNIANVNTPGYSRQRVISEAGSPLDRGTHITGSGVDMVQLTRVRDEVIDTKYRSNNTELSYWDRASTKLEELEKNITGINQNLSDSLNKFWDGWEAVADNPSSNAERINLLETSKFMSSNFNEYAQMIDSKRKEINTEINNSATEINKITAKLAVLGKKIDVAEAQGKDSNDLLDQFDLAIDELTEFGEVRVTNIDNKRVVYLGSDEIMQNGVANKVMVKQNENIDDKYNSEIVWESSRNQISGLSKGKIQGLKNIRDNVLTEYENEIDILANDMVDKINQLHEGGFSLGENSHSGISFFDTATTGALDIKISDELLLDPDNIVASLAGEEGDNRVALQIANLRYEKTIENKQSYNEYLNSITSKMGNDVSSFKNYQQAYSDTSVQIDNFRESIKGVSINEETADLIKFQQAYQASAKIISEANKLMSVIIELV